MTQRVEVRLQRYVRIGIDNSLAAQSKWRSQAWASWHGGCQRHADGRPRNPHVVVGNIIRHGDSPNPRVLHPSSPSGRLFLWMIDACQQRYSQESRPARQTRHGLASCMQAENHRHISTNPDSRQMLVTDNLVLMVTSRKSPNFLSATLIPWTTLFAMWQPLAWQTNTFLASPS